MDAYTEGSLEGIPEHARQRLADSRGTADKRGLFTSDLSVNEFLLAREAGFDPVGLVMGSSIYHIGWQMPGLRQSMELDILTQAMYAARELAMTRMEEEADALDADGVIGVRLEVSRSEWGEHLAEFMAIGTAVRARDAAGRYRAPSGRPFTSDLSGQDLVAQDESNLLGGIGRASWGQVLGRRDRIGQNRLAGGVLDVALVVGGGSEAGGVDTGEHHHEGKTGTDHGDLLQEVGEDRGR